MYVGGDILDGYWLSGEVFKKLPIDAIFAGDRSAGIGFCEDFIRVGNTSLYDGLIRLQTATGTAIQIASEANHSGILRLTSAADNDEAVIQLGNGLDVGPFRLQKDFAFECCVRLNAAAIVAGDHGFFAGMWTGGASGGAIANLMFTAGDAIYATANLVGFQHLVAESTALDAVYQASGQTKVDGAVDTDLDTVQTMVAGTWYKLGYRFSMMAPRRLEWYVDGVKVCEIGETAIAAAGFPDADTAFIQPTIGMRGVDATTAYLDIDWMACAQLV